jgi:hypothetical protein
VHGRGNTVEVAAPAGDRERAGCRLDAHAGAEVDIGRAPFDTGAARVRAARDEQRLGGGLRALEHVRRRDVEAPVAQHASAHAITREPAVAVEVEPHLAFEAQLVLRVGILPA